MTRPSNRKLLLFGVISVGYVTLSAIVLVFSAIRVCGMTPDQAELCDPSPIAWFIAALFAGYVGIAVLFFKARISGVD